MDKQQKAERIEHYDQEIKSDGFAILAEFNKVGVGDMETFRRDLTAVGCTAVILKNTLARIVFERKGLEEICEYLVGTSILFYGDEEIAPAAKILAKLLRRYPGMQVKAIVYESNVFQKEEFKTFTSMPTKDEVRSQLLSILKAPQSNFVRVVNASQRIVGVLDAYAKKQAG